MKKRSNNYERFKEENKLFNLKSSMKRACEYCQHRVSFYVFERKDRKICKYCGHYVYRDDKTAFKYKLKEKLDNGENNR